MNEEWITDEKKIERMMADGVIFNIECMMYGRDDRILIGINLDKWRAFIIRYAGNHEWHIEGGRFNYECGWIEEDLLASGKTSTKEAAKFIAHANAYYRKNPAVSRIETFTSIILDVDAYLEDMEKLLKLARKYEKRRRFKNRKED